MGILCFYEYCNLFIAIAKNFGKKEFTRKEFNKLVGSESKRKLEKMVSMKVFSSRSEKVEIEIPPNKKIEIEKYYYTISYDNLLKYFDLLEKGSIRYIKDNYDREISYIKWEIEDTLEKEGKDFELKLIPKRVIEKVEKLNKRIEYVKNSKEKDISNMERNYNETLEILRNGF